MLNVPLLFYSKLMLSFCSNAGIKTNIMDNMCLFLVLESTHNATHTHIIMIRYNVRVLEKEDMKHKETVVNV